MEYLLITILQVLGVSFHVGQKVIEIDKRTEGDTFRQVLGVFMNENRITLFLSGAVLLLNVVAHYIVGSYTDLPETMDNYALYSFAVAFVLGYAGQRLIYKGLGRAEEVISKKIEDRLSK